MDAKKLEILERASNVYMKYGIKSITMDALASELGISKKTIYKYFEDKNELIQSIIVLKAEMDKAMCLECQLNSKNAIDNLINISSLVVEHLGNVNSTVFYDLKKYYPDAWSILEAHKWEFILSAGNPLEHGFSCTIDSRAAGRQHVRTQTYTLCITKQRRHYLDLTPQRGL